MPLLQKPVADKWKMLTYSSKSLLLILSSSNLLVVKKINKVFSNLVLASSRQMVLTPYCDMPSLLTRWIQVDLLDKYSWLVQKTAADHTCWSIYRTCIRISFLQQMQQKSDTLLEVKFKLSRWGKVEYALTCSARFRLLVRKYSIPMHKAGKWQLQTIAK